MQLICVKQNILFVFIHKPFSHLVFPISVKGTTMNLIAQITKLVVMFETFIVHLDFTH